MESEQTIWGQGGHVFIGAISRALCLVNKGEQKTNDSPYYSRMGVHLAATLQISEDPKPPPVLGLCRQPKGPGAQCTSQAVLSNRRKQAGLWAGGSPM